MIFDLQIPELEGCSVVRGTFWYIGAMSTRDTHALSGRVRRSPLRLSAPVKVEKTWYDEIGEGNISTGVTISDALDQYDIICINDMELGGALQGIYVRHSDSYHQETDAAPSDILPDERGNAWTKLQWAEACQRLGMLR